MQPLRMSPAPKVFIEGCLDVLGQVSPAIRPATALSGLPGQVYWAGITA